MWKFRDFSVTQFLCEINFGEYRSLETAIAAILGVLEKYTDPRIHGPDTQTF